MSVEMSWRALRAVLMRPAVRAVGVALMLVCFVAAAAPRTGGNFRAVAVLVYLPDPAYTYGPAAAVIGGVLIGSAQARISATLFVNGRSRSYQLLSAVVLAGLLATILRFVAVIGLVLGAIGSSFWSARADVNASIVLSGQGRVLLLHVLAGFLGVTLGFALSNLGAALVGAAALVVPYLPFSAVLLLRARDILWLYQWLPFGALRAITTGNAGLFGDNPALAYTSRVSVACLVFAVWVGSFILASWRSGPGSLFDRGAAAPGLALAVVAAAVAGLLMPDLARTVPWEWRPTWRDATAHGVNSRQVVQSWVGSVRSHNGISETARYFADRGLATRTPSDVDQSIQRATSIVVEPTSAMAGPTNVEVQLSYAPAIRSGVLLVPRSSLQVTLITRGGGFLISGVEGPNVSIVVSR